MNIFKRHWYKIIIFLLTFAPFAQGFGDDNDFGDFDFDLAQLEAFEQEHPVDLRGIPINPSLYATFLSLIKQPLWKNTKSPEGRDILYLLPHKITAIEYGGCAFNLFFNMTNQMDVTVNGLFNFEDQLSPQEFDDIIGGLLGGADPQEVEQLLPLFKNITIQERKFGGLILFGFVKGPFTAQLHSSVQLGARNFFLKPRDANEIKDFFKMKFPDAPPFDEREFYIIRVGLGDTRFKFGLNTINMTSFQTDIGFETILPTSRLSYTPKLNIGLVQPVFNTDELQDSAVAVLRGIRDYLVNPELGNNGHLGFGCYFESKVSLFHDSTHLWIRASYDILFRNDEDRLFMFKQTLTPEDLSAVLDDPAGEQTVTDYIRQYVFPSSFKAFVRPGGVTNIVCGFNFNFSKHCQGALGYDFYAQKKEIIFDIRNTSIDISQLNIEGAQSPGVQQHKIFSEILYHDKRQKHDWGIGLGGDVTVSNKNIGADWTLYLKVASSF